ncbi:hypothetical protein CFOL_v3_09680 [Cephalotus follicularis]|uniref:UBN2_3 domain-containing protein n=1 Tax=Cephalotus follicularis TaxID=3775 RepID=A0A1Q3BDT6_CEPFO|nr:hypothetical protein CFOL_v3_09680 [Cephalotus follicularis]
MTVDTYFAKLSTIWHELDVYEDLYEGLDATTVTKLQTKEERNRVYQFLMGLNSEFDVVVQTTLQKEPFPSIKEAFSAVNQESGRKDEKQSPIIERSALVSSNAAPRNSERPVVKCDHCGKLYHTKETCWKIIGRPPGPNPTGPNKYKGKGRPQAHEAQIMGVFAKDSVGTGGLTGSTRKEEIQQIVREMMGSTSSSHIASTAATHSAPPTQQFSGISISSNSWVINSGATDHMIGSSGQF